MTQPDRSYRDTVYVLTSFVAYEGEAVLSVWRTREAARQAALRYRGYEDEVVVYKCRLGGSDPEAVDRLDVKVE